MDRKRNFANSKIPKLHSPWHKQVIVALKDEKRPKFGQNGGKKIQNRKF